VSNNIDPENLNIFSIPEAMLEKLFEFTGDADHSKGFILAYVDQQGKPMVYTRSQNQIIEMGLRKALEKYLISLEEAESMYGAENNDDPDNNKGLD
jgi:UDP-N-acetylmuramate-alanine ligase